MGPAISIQSTTDYSIFKVLHANRDVNDPHVLRVKESIEAHPELLPVQPIVVNEHMEVVDGQHRLDAVKMLRMPAFYVVSPGTTITEARLLNVTNRAWKAEDYAKSYADTGNIHYINYQKLRDEYGVGHSIIISTAYGDSSGAYAAFKRGEFEIADIDLVTERLKFVEYIGSLIGITPSRDLVKALVRLHSTLTAQQLNKLAEKVTGKAERFKKVSGITDNLRLLEELYNLGRVEANRERLF